MSTFSDSANPPDTVTLMAIGDVHLGTQPGSLPPDLCDLAVEPNKLTPEAGLVRAVECAIEKRVDAVLFAGDVVESSNARFEAMPPLESAVQRLLAENIPVYAVAGNHDVEALPRLAALIDGFTLLGCGGNWESTLIHKQGRPALEIVGWSFPQKQVRDSPVAKLLQAPPAPLVPGIPRLGVLHGDFNASGGTYAPFTHREITNSGLDAWVFGHIHRPSLSHSEGLLHGYLGSLVGLDPSEQGQHGPWLLRSTDGATLSAEQLPLAPLRWEQLDIAVKAHESPDDIADRLVDESEQFAQKLHEQGCPPHALGLRLRLTGASQHYEEISRCIKDRSWESIRRRSGETVVFVNKVLNGLELAIDLQEIAGGNDPPALLARRLLMLRQDSEARQAFLAEARLELRAIDQDLKWRPLQSLREPHDPLSDEALLGTLEQAAVAALHALLAQHTVPGKEHA